VRILPTPESYASENDLEILGEQGDNDRYEWNEIHAIVLDQNHVKYDGEFNVTISTEVAFTGGTWVPYGSIFGELQWIHWDDEPEPMITIKPSDFWMLADGNYLFLYLFGEYYEPGEGKRYAYSLIEVQFINHSPEPVVHVAVEGTENWKNVTKGGQTSYKIPIDGSVNVLFDGTSSWDKDHDENLEWNWDLDSDGRFGHTPTEREASTSRYFTAGKYVLGLSVGDGEDVSEIVEFTLLVFEPPRRSDLQVTDITISGRDGSNTAFDFGDILAISLYIENIGSNDTQSPFSTSVEYSSDNGVHYSLIESVTTLISLSPTKQTEIYILWDISIPALPLVDYQIRIRTDISNNITEEDESNNLLLWNIALQDTIAPEILLPFQINEVIDENNVKQLSITGEASDNHEVEWIEYRVGNGGQWIQGVGDTSWVIMIDTSEMESGDHGVEIRAYDGYQYSEIKRTFVEIEEEKKEDEGFLPSISAPSIVILITLSTVIRWKRRRKDTSLK